MALFFGQKCSAQELQNKVEARINDRALKPHALISSAALLTSSQIGLYLMILQLGVGACRPLCWGKLPGIARLQFTVARWNRKQAKANLAVVLTPVI